MTEVGATLSTRQEIESMHPGAVIKYDGSQIRRVRSFSGWLTENGEHQLDSQIELNRWTVEILGDPRPDTLARFTQRFHTAALGASYANSITIAPVEAALGRMGLHDMPLSIGMAVHRSDQQLGARLPIGTICAYGMAHQWSHFALYQLTGVNDWNRITGGMNLNGWDVMTLVSVPTGTTLEDWASAEAEENDAERIQEFMARAWALGNKARQDNSWCGEYGRAMARMGINAVTAGQFRTPPAVGSTFILETDNRMPFLPVGSTITHVGEHTYTRTGNNWVGADGSFTVAQLTRGHYSVDSLPDYWVGQHLTTLEQTEGMPVGSVIGLGNAEYIRNSNGVRPWTRGGVTHRSSDFSSGWSLTAENLTTVVSVGSADSGDSVTEPARVWAVGDRVTSVEEMNTLPVGTQVSIYGNASGLYCKYDEHQWRSGARGVTHDESAFAASFNRLTVHSLPMPTVGDIIASVEDLERLPIGARITTNLGASYDRTVDGWRYVGGSTTHPSTSFSGYFGNGQWVRLESMPAETEYAVGYTWLVQQDLSILDALPVGTQILRLAGNQDDVRMKVSATTWTRRDTTVDRNALRGDHRIIRLGMDETPETITAVEVGQPITIEQSSAMPIGGIVRAHLQGETRYYRRDEGCGFPGGVANLNGGGTWPGRATFSDQRVILVWYGQGGVDYRPSTIEEAGALPVGTRVQMLNESHAWTKLNDTDWQISTGTGTIWQTNQFRRWIETGSFRVLTFPGAES